MIYSEAIPEWKVWLKILYRIDLLGDLERMHSLKCLNKKRLLSTERRRFRFGENTLLGMLAIMSKRVHNQQEPT